MTDEELLALERLTKAATAGPWQAIPDEGVERLRLAAPFMNLREGEVVIERPPQTRDEAAATFFEAVITGFAARGDVAFVCAARSAVPLLIEEVRFLRRLLADQQLDGHEIQRHTEALRAIAKLTTNPIRHSTFERLHQAVMLAREALGQTVPCKVCEGKGKVFSNGGPYESSWDDCEACGGTGVQ